MEPCSICGKSGDMEGWGGFEGTFYCHACWEKWWNRVCLAWRNGKSDDHFDFIEVGTSDWGTVSQYCAGDFQSGSSLAMEIERDDLRQSRGLSVEAVKEHLDRLPELAHVKKVDAAMDEHSGEACLFYVSAANIDRYMGLYYTSLVTDVNGGTMTDGEHGDNQQEEWPMPTVDVMWYAKSLSSIGEPQPDLVYMLEAVGRSDLLECRRVCTLNWADLCAAHGVRTVDVVQIDCEGKDCAILRGLLAHCAKDPMAYPRIIKFELNHLTARAEADATMAALADSGYVVTLRSFNNVIVERSGSVSAEVVAGLAAISLDPV